MSVVRIWKKHSIDRGVRSGVEEIREPYMYGNGRYQVADPKLGKGYNKKENAVEVASLDDVAKYVCKGFAVRMRSGVGKPSLNKADGIQIEER